MVEFSFTLPKYEQVLRTVVSFGKKSKLRLGCLVFVKASMGLIPVSSRLKGNTACGAKAAAGVSAVE